jgi:divalent metal cation (Fe/Co/Zn/Cd) transporter
MKEFDDLKGIWKAQSITPSQTAPGMLDKAIAEQRKAKRHQLVQSILYFSTFIALLIIDYVNRKVIEVSFPGLVILLACTLFYAVIKLWLFHVLHHIALTESTTVLLKKLERYKRINRYVLREGNFIYSIILTLGVYLYAWPLLQHVGVALLVTVGVLYVAWAAFNTFYLKKREAKQEEQRIHELIEAIQRSSI